jgi:hypothetical protein
MRGGRFYGYVALTAALCAAAAAPAFGDVDQFVPNAVQPSSVVGGTGAEPGSGTASPLTSYPGEGATCSAPYSAPIEAWHDYFSIGNCLNTWSGIVDDWNYPGANGTDWDGGSWGGDFGNNCGYIQSTFASPTGGGGATSCPAGYQTPDTAFIAPYAGDPAGLAIWSNQPGLLGDDGVAVRNNSACWEFANLQPWSPSESPVDAVRITQPPAAGQPNNLFVRYETKYTWGSSPWYLVRDNAWSGTPGEGNWVFVAGTQCNLVLPNPNG